MPDREKVIKWLEECQKPEYSCMNCPYYLVVDESAVDEAVLEHCTDQLMADALALIREQKPVMATHLNGSSVFRSACGSCGMPLYAHDFRYCPYCGRGVKWDD